MLTKQLFYNQLAGKRHRSRHVNNDDYGSRSSSSSSSSSGGINIQSQDPLHEGLGFRIATLAASRVVAKGSRGAKALGLVKGKGDVDDGEETKGEMASRAKESKGKGKRK